MSDSVRSCFLSVTLSQAELRLIGGRAAFFTHGSVRCGGGWRAVATPFAATNVKQRMGHRFGSTAFAINPAPLVRFCSFPDGADVRKSDVARSKAAPESVAGCAISSAPCSEASPTPQLGSLLTVLDEQKPRHLRRSTERS